MSKRLVFFTLWCVGLVAVAAVSAAFAWDPFADSNGEHTGPGEHTRQHGGHSGGGFWFFGGGGGAGGSGPAHK
jgi:hypothetical protein